MRIKKASGERQQLITELLRAGFVITYTKDYYVIDQDIYPADINIEIQHINDLDKICKIFNRHIIYNPNAEVWDHHIVIYDDYME